MTEEKKTSDARLRATRAWEERNKEHTKYKRNIRSTRWVIRNVAKREDLVELRDLIDERIAEIDAAGEGEAEEGENA